MNAKHIRNKVNRPADIGVMRTWNRGRGQQDKISGRARSPRPAATTKKGIAPPGPRRLY